VESLRGEVIASDAGGSVNEQHISKGGEPEARGIIAGNL